MVFTPAGITRFPVQYSAEIRASLLSMKRQEDSLLGLAARAGEIGMAAKDAETSIAPSTNETALRHREAIAIHPETLGSA
jgi:hypothetical protein